MLSIMSFSTRGGACGVFIEQTQLKPRHKSITAHSRLPRISTAPLKAKSHEKFPSRHKWAVQGAQGAFIILLSHPNYNVSNPCPENISYYTTQPSIGPRFAHRTTQTIKALCQFGATLRPLIYELPHITSSSSDQRTTRDGNLCLLR